MFQAPKKLKFKRFHKIKLKHSSTENNLFCPKFGDYGLQAQTMGKLNSAQLEAGRLVVRRFSKKRAFLKINVFPYLATTKKPTASRMGKGKGKLADWICPIKRGRIIYEISSLGGKFKGSLPLLALKLVNRKLPLRARPVRLVY